MIAERMREPGPSDAAAGNALRLMFPATDGAVPTALRQWRHAILAWGTCAELTGRAEIVLAEVLNNIVEHGIVEHGAADGATIWIGLRCTRVTAGLHVVVTDRGRPLPSDLLTPQRPPRSLPCDLALAEVPEGGFGWQMIHLLARDLSCQRESDGNRLRFLIPHQVART